MQKRIITLLCAAGLAISAPAFSAALKVRPDAPTRYVVKQGDTLWGISGKYLYRPWQWSRLWGANRSKIRNPDRIYPGQVLVLRYVNGRPRLSVERGAGGDIPLVKLSPRVREVSSGYGIQAINVNFYRMFMQHPQVIDQMQTQHAPRLVEGPDNRLIYSKGDRVYAYEITEPGRYLVYRARKDITDPETKKYLGQEVVFSGIVATLPSTNSALDSRSREDAEALPNKEYYTRLHPMLKVPTQTAQPMVVEEVVSEIRKGDYLLKLEDGGDSFNMMPHAPSQHIDAKVVSIFDGISEAGQFQTITLNKGSAHGLEKGTVLSLYKRSRQVKMDMPKGKDGSRSVVKYLSIPAEEAGLAMVYRVSQNLASAIILESKTNISIGDTASEPGQDLDNMLDDGRHEPNVPQDPHDDEHNTINILSNIH
ncbi:periplasmic protein (possibly peptidoglycan-binding) [Neisseria elongata]|uniref:Periplasmic protein (Possibly peptidoglycan-binding) n=1 Tax=Neisseria elongata TaxID=495 RepID=A0A378TUI0_NEIEL|nr:LysM peptidoglycan-binding domain-containing protein [Neisseria elongata]SFH00409.1 LysM domain-containing protein [Neisseria elongata subsp. elongata]STZ66685.1 periplasmic protein (possibly peptidoglycan-binding) [Neisseria elongata]